MILLIGLLSILIIMKYKSTIFNFKKYRYILLFSMLLSVIITFVSTTISKTSSSIYRLHAGFPIKWLHQNIGFSLSRSHIDVTDVFNTTIRLDFLIINILLIYSLSVGLYKYLKHENPRD